MINTKLTMQFPNSFSQSKKAKFHRDHKGPSFWYELGHSCFHSHSTLGGDVASTTPGCLGLPAMQVTITAGWTGGAPEIASLNPDSNWRLQCGGLVPDH